jgi:hypothetical protein
VVLKPLDPAGRLGLDLVAAGPGGPVAVDELGLVQAYGRRAAEEFRRRTASFPAECRYALGATGTAGTSRSSPSSAPTRARWGYFADIPLLLLTTTDAKTGQARSTPLAYMADGGPLRRVRRGW